MKEFDINNVNRNNWKKFRFEEIAYSISERVEPKDTHLQVYVGLEHLDPETIHIKRTGTPADVEGTKLKVYKGDVIFGRRRAYQRKAAIADFDGICSAHALVLRAKEKVIDPNLFPFFLHSDYFMHKAIDISVGSLSPTINWGTLKNQEFLLPPREHQAQLAELLWAADDVVEKEVYLKHSFKTLMDSLIKFYVLNGNSSEYKRILLNEVIEKLEAGVSVNSEIGDINEDDIAILMTSAVSSGVFIPTEIKKVIKGELNRVKTSVKGDSIIISRMNTAELVGANVYVSKDFPNLYLPDRLWQTVIKRKDVLTKYLWYILSSSEYRKRISSLCGGTSNSMKNISKEDFLNLEVLIPSLASQSKIIAKIEAIEEAIILLDEKRRLSSNFLKKLINQIFNV